MIRAILLTLGTFSAVGIVLLSYAITYDFGRVDQGRVDTACLQQDAEWADLAACVGRLKR